MGRDYTYALAGARDKPKLLLSGGRDEFATPAQLAEVFAAAAEPKRLVIDPGSRPLFHRAPGSRCAPHSACGLGEITGPAVTPWPYNSAHDARPAGVNGCCERARCAPSRGRFFSTRWRRAASSAASPQLHYERGILQVGDDLYDLGTFSRVFVVCLRQGGAQQPGGADDAAGRGRGRHRNCLRAHAAGGAGLRLPLFRGRPSDAKPRIAARRPRPFFAHSIR